MASPARTEMRWIWSATVPLRDRVLEDWARAAVLQADVEFGTGIGRSDIPAFSFRFTPQFGGDVGRGMDLKRKFLLGVEDFEEKRKARRVRDFAEDLRAVMLPEMVQGLPAPRADADDALRFGTIDDLPRFADAKAGRQMFCRTRSRAGGRPRCAP